MTAAGFTSEKASNHTHLDGLPVTTTADDIELAYLVNAIVVLMGQNALRYSHSRDNQPSLAPITAALCYIHDNNQKVLPAYKQCLEAEDKRLQGQMIMAIVRAIRDLIIAFANDFPSNQLWLSSIPHALYPSNVLTVLACFHHEQSPLQGENLYNSSIWNAMVQLIDFGREHPDDPSTAILPETLAWLATHPEAEEVKAIVTERGVATREAIEEILNQKKQIVQPVSEGVL